MEIQVPDSNPYLISPLWLGAHLEDPDIAIIDASWYLADHNRDAKAEYKASHIPGAVFFDLDLIADHATNLPHMLPSEKAFAKAVGQMGISNDDTIVVYDGLGLFSAARVWWTFRVFGAQKVFILNGGFPAWVAAGLPVSASVEAPAEKKFVAKLDRSKVRSKADMADLIRNASAAIADARPAARFAGTAPEPRAGLRSGHMPGASSVPINLLVEDGMLKSRSEIESVFASQRLDLTGDVVTTCGSGVTAAIISLALDSIGHTDHALYDGSWAEWGQEGDTPVVLGAIEPVMSKQAKARFLNAHITELEMKSRPARREPLPIGSKVSLLKARSMVPSFYRYLYREVGKPHHWFIRRGMSDEQLKNVLSSNSSEVWVLYVDGCPAGFFELDFELMPDRAEIQYFGLIAEYQGRGLAKFMLSEAINAAWERAPQIVSIQTNTLDSPKALVLYQKAGFEPVGTYDEMIEAWD
jgi:thiosulfate/3-mercaptopyruvate sulfurtransferase